VNINWIKSYSLYKLLTKIVEHKAIEFKLTCNRNPCFVPSLSSCHEKATVSLYFGRILIRLEVADFPSFRLIFWLLSSCCNLLLQSHQAEIIVNRLIKDVTTRRRWELAPWSSSTPQSLGRSRVAPPSPEWELNKITRFLDRTVAVKWWFNPLGHAVDRKQDWEQVSVKLVE